MAQTASLQPGRGQRAILRFLGDLHRLRVPGTNPGGVSAFGRAGRAADRLSRRILIGPARTEAPSASGRVASVRSFSRPVSMLFEAAPSSPAPVKNAFGEGHAPKAAPSAAPGRELSRTTASHTPFKAAETRPSITRPIASAPSESLAERISMRRRGDAVTLTPPIAASPVEPAIAEAHPVAQDLTLSRAAIPTVSWLGVSAPEPVKPEPETFEARGRMPAAPAPSMQPLAPRFSSVPADTMARSHGPSPLPTSDLMRQASSQDLPPAEREPDAPGDENTGGSVPPATGQDFGRHGSIQAPDMSVRPLASRPMNGSATPDAPRDMPSSGIIDAPPTSARRDAPEMALRRMPELRVNDRRMPEDFALADKTPHRNLERTDAFRVGEAIPQASGTLLREIDVVDRVTRLLPRWTRTAMGLLARSPFVPASLGVPERMRPVSEAPLASPLVPTLFSARDVPDIEPALSAAPMRAMLPTGNVTAAASARPVLVRERPGLPARAAIPGGRDAAADVRVAISSGRDAMDVRVPEMPLPPRDRTAVAASAGMLVQRSETGSSPAGSSPPPVSAAQPAPAQDAGHTAEPGSGGANEVNLLAGEVWALLRRRLAYEAERMGR